MGWNAYFSGSLIKSTGEGTLRYFVYPLALLPDLAFVGFKTNKAITFLQVNIWSRNRNTVNFTDPDVDTVILTLDKATSVVFQDRNTSHSFNTFHSGIIEGTNANDEFYPSRYYEIATKTGGGIKLWVEVVIL